MFLTRSSMTSQLEGRGLGHTKRHTILTNKKRPHEGAVFRLVNQGLDGAAERIRTFDLSLTKGMI